MSTKKTFSTETSERYSRALYEISKETKELEKVENDIKNFQKLFNSSVEIKNFLQDPTQNINKQIEKRRIFYVKKIFESFLKYCSKNRGEIEASLISSKELSVTELETISKELSSSTKSNLKFNYKVEKELIGGLKLQLGSFMIDTSIKNKLKKFEQAMLEN